MNLTEMQRAVFRSEASTRIERKRFRKDEIAERCEIFDKCPHPETKNRENPGIDYAIYKRQAAAGLKEFIGERTLEGMSQSGTETGTHGEWLLVDGVKPRDMMHLALLFRRAGIGLIGRGIDNFESGINRWGSPPLAAAFKCRGDCRIETCGVDFFRLSRTDDIPLIVIRPGLLESRDNGRGSLLFSLFGDRGSARRNSQGRPGPVDRLKNLFYQETRLHPTDPHRKVEEVQARILARHGAGLRREELADAVQWSPGWLSQCFRKHSGILLDAYMERIRFCRALWAVSASGLLIKRIAYDCGYADPLHFGKVFKKRFGLSPALARRRIAKLYLTQTPYE